MNVSPSPYTPPLYILRATLDAVPSPDGSRSDASESSGDALALYVALHNAAHALAPLTDSFYLGFYDAVNRRIQFDYNEDDGLFEKPEPQPLGNGPTSRVLRTGVPFHDGDADLTPDERRTVQDGGMAFGDAERLSRAWLHLPLWVASSDASAPATSRAAPPSDDAPPRGATSTPSAPFGVMGILSYTPGAFADPAVRMSLAWLAEYAARRFHDAETARLLHAAITDRDALAVAHVDALDALAQTAARLVRQARTGAENAPGKKAPSRDFRDGAASLAPSLENWLHACRRAQTNARQIARLAPPPARLVEARRLLALLTPSERAVAERYAGGLSLKDIASTLCIAESTVKSHVTHIREKIGAANQARVARLLGPALDEA